MRRILLITLAILVLLPSKVFAQGGGTSGGSGSLHGVGAPSNPCTAGTLYTNDSNGTAYSCNAGTWATISGSSANLSGMTAGQIPVAATATSITSSVATTGSGSVVLAVAPTITGHPTIEGVTSTGATGTGNYVFSVAPTLTGHPTIEGVTSTGATGTGNYVFSIAPTITGHPTIEGVTSTGATGTGLFVFATSPTLTTPVLGVATGTSINLGATGALSTTAQSGTGSLCMTNNCVMNSPSLGAATGTSLNLNSTGVLGTTAQSGTGIICMTTNCAMTTPNLGTPSAVALTNATALPCSATPALTGDATTVAGNCAVTVVNVNGSSVPASPSVHQSLVATAANTLSWKTITDCNGSSNALNYTQSTDTYSCNNITTLSNPMTTLGDMIIGGASGAVTRLPGPSSPNGVTFTLVSTPSSGAATTQVWGQPGIPVDAQSGAGYTIVASDRSNYLSLSNASAQTLTLPVATGNFGTNYPFVTQNIGGGAWTITPTTQTVNGVSTDVLPSKGAAFVYQDLTPNWFTIKFPTFASFSNCTDSGGNHLNFTVSTLTFSCGTSSTGGTFYQTVDSNASAATQRPTLNLISGSNATVSCVDNAGATRTDCTISASSSAGARLDQLTAATGADTINNADNAIVWNWSATTSGKSVFTIGENVASTSAGTPFLLNIQTLAASTLNPLVVTARGTANGVQVDAATGLLHPIGTGGIQATTLNIATTTCTNQVVSAISSAGAGTCHTIVGGDMASATVTSTQLAAQYSKRACGFGLGDSVNAIAAATYPASGQFLQCVNNSGVTWTVTGLHCFTDNAGTSTMNVYNNAGTSLLTGAITCNATKTSGGAAGTQSATTTIATTDGLNFVFVADGTSKYVTATVDFTY